MKRPELCVCCKRLVKCRGKIVLIGKLHAQLGVAFCAKKSERIVIIY